MAESLHPSPDSDADFPAALPSELARMLSIGGPPMPGSGGRGWWAFPTRKNPRLLIPLAAEAWPAALGLLAHSRRAVWLRRALPWLSRCGLAPAWHASGSGSPLDAWLGGLLDRPPVHYAVYLGTPSIFAKQTVQCQNAAGEVVAYVKVPEGPRSGEAIRHEWDVLSMLAERFPGESWFPARLGYEGEVAAQGPPPLATSPGMATVSQAAEACGRLNRMEPRAIAWEESPVRRELDSAIGAGADEDEITRMLRDSLGVLDARLAGGSPLHRFSHGDFLPWNTRGLGDCAFVFDWEWAGWRLPFHDAYHYLLVPLLGSGTLAMDPLLTRLPQSGAFLAAQGQATHGAGDDPLWCLAFLAERLAFYSRSCLEAGDLPGRHRTVTDLMQLLRVALATSGESGQPLHS